MTYSKFLENFYKEKSIGVYKLCFSNGYYYIGRSMDIHKRYSQHCDKLIKQKHINKNVQKAYNETLKLPLLEIILLSDEYFLNRKEGRIIEKHKEDDFCLNKNGSVDRTPKTRRANKIVVERRILIDGLSRKEFKYILDKYKTVDNALLTLIEIDNPF